MRIPGNREPGWMRRLHYFQNGLQDGVIFQLFSPKNGEIIMAAKLFDRQRPPYILYS